MADLSPFTICLILQLIAGLGGVYALSKWHQAYYAQRHQQKVLDFREERKLVS